MFKGREFVLICANLWLKPIVNKLIKTKRANKPKDLFARE